MYIPYDLVIQLQRVIWVRCCGPYLHFSINHVPFVWPLHCGDSLEEACQPPRLPYVSPLDYCAWGWMKDIVYQRTAQTREELLARIMHSSTEIKDMRVQLCRATRVVHTREANRDEPAFPGCLGVNLPAQPCWFKVLPLQMAANISRAFKQQHFRPVAEGRIKSKHRLSKQARG
ncbi:hypothetical protein PR048_018908 [Dryococelus australis]|uniref:Uncharacterized protein n=1 Tax=Dryococelus australis TaxID=614101 RepID=A0ABQ9H2B9_9NEOP|nr:hypothetical protein PR048_018908 [Dryococelus australis]